MKKLILLIGMFICLCGCTEQSMVRDFGGSMTIKLPAGQEILPTAADLCKNFEKKPLSKEINRGIV